MGDDPLDDVPDGDVFQSQCPSCKAWQDDYDGFGVLFCPCGYCGHPSSTNGTCDVCGRPSQPGEKRGGE